MVAITTGAVIILILIGSLVRMTDSGMGCPDWPKCFGQIIPPTDVSQLPADYQTLFAVAGREIAEFDAFKTWVEYLNRLFGVLVGLCAVIVLGLSLGLRKIDTGLVWISLASLLLIVLEGGIGAYVVMTHLETSAITIHMVVALGILACYLWAITRNGRGQISEVWVATPVAQDWWATMVLLGLIVSQIVMGTQVREQIDLLHSTEVARSEWISLLKSPYGIHKFSHYAIMAAMAFVTWRLWPKADALGRKMLLVSISLIGAEVLMGLGMHHLSVPKMLQPLHLLFAALLFSSQFVLMRWTWIGMRQQKNVQQPLVHGH
ncbi:MAG: cytochrome c oxidase assembly protein subunit 15 [Chloroflexi bacterium AL-W]|nr:cytochrome c oxidase assembly protein subunit 15 [Chloroflexi bacterium AL-W]